MDWVLNVQDPWVEALAMHCEADQANKGVRNNTSTPNSSPLQVKFRDQHPLIIFSDPMVICPGTRATTVPVNSNTLIKRGR